MRGVNPTFRLMKSHLLSILMLIAVSGLPAEAAAPANDLFSRARILTGRYVKLLNQTGVGSTSETFDPNLQGTKPARTVWYRLDGGMNLPGNVNFAELRITDRAGLSAGLFRQVDREAGLGGLMLMNENANTTANDTEFFSFGLQPNEPVYLCVSANGSFDLQLKLGSADCDFFGQHPVQSGTSVSLTKYLSPVVPPTDEGDIPPLTEKPPLLNQGIWLTWNPSFTGTAIMDTSFSALENDAIEADTYMAVYTGADLASLVKVAEDDNSGYLNAARVSMAVTAGTPYHLWIGKRGDALPTQKLELRCYQSGTPGRIVHSAESVYANENQGSAQFRIRRMGGDAAVGASLTLGGSATLGTDYTVASTAVNFPSGNSDAAYLQTVTVQILPDTVKDDAENISYALTAATGGAALQGSTRSIYIYDPYVEAQAYFQFSEAGPLVVRESSGQILLPIEVTRNTTQRQFFKAVFSSNSTARIGEDLELGNTTIVIGTGISPAVSIKIIQDYLYEGQESFDLIGYTQVEGGEYTKTSEMTVVIEDDDMVVPKAGRAAVNLQSGSVQFATSSTGSITGRLVLSSGSFAFSGRLDSRGQFITVLGPEIGVRQRLALRQVDAKGNYLVGLSPSTQPQPVNSLVSVLLTAYTSSSPCPAAGVYTIIENSGEISEDIPYAAVASLQVDKLGNSKLTGRLFDGTSFTASGFTNADRVCHVGASIYGAKGRLLAELNLPSVVQTHAQGDGYLTKPGRANQTNEARSIMSNLEWKAVRYTPPARNQRILSLWNPPEMGEVRIASPYEIRQSFTLSTTNKPTFVRTRDRRLVSLTFLPATGWFSGTVRLTPTASTRSYYGVVHQLGSWENEAGGHGFVSHPITPTAVNLNRAEEL